jgi:CheY-like chemotaxis protein
MFPVILVVDADEVRARRVARLLTLTDYRAVVTTNAYQAVERLFHEHISPHVILVGQNDIVQQPIFQRLLHHLYQQGNKRGVPPLIPLPPQIKDEVPLYADGATHATHMLSRSALDLLEYIWRAAPALRKNFITPPHSLVMTKLPAMGLTPRASAYHSVRNFYFAQLLNTAQKIIGEAQWPVLMNDVGLSQYRETRNWPFEDESLSIPAEYISCLNQAVAFSAPENPVQQLYKWGRLITQTHLRKRMPSGLAKQVFRIRPLDSVMSSILKSFTEDMNAIRNEQLHEWRVHPEGGYLVVHYSNLFAYGRNVSLYPGCHVWKTTLEGVLDMMNIDGSWEVREKECSGQTLTGHCLFEIMKNA